MSLFLSLFLMMAGGAILYVLFEHFHLPALIGYLLFGILLGWLGLIDDSILAISSQIRKIALIIILSKAGLSLNLSDLKKVGRPAILMSFVPACIEMCAVGIFALLLFPLSYTDSFLLGSVLGAVSPAVVVPAMSKLLDEKRGTKKGIPQLIIAGSSIDDIVMIVFYQAFMTIEKGEKVSYLTFLNIPLSIFSGIAVGVGIGFLLVLLFAHISLRDSLKLILIFGIGFGLTALEDFLARWFGFSSLLAIISLCIVIKAKAEERAVRLAKRGNQMWVLAEMFLFLLVGASLKMEYTSRYFFLSIALLTISLSFRSLAVASCLVRTNLNFKERTFVVFSYFPKATVQAAIGGGLLDLGNQMLAQKLPNAEPIVQSGVIVLSVSVVSILLTAPLGAILLRLTAPHLLSDDAKETLEKNDPSPNLSSPFLQKFLGK